MEPMVALHGNPSDEVLQTAAQYGIQNILVYGGPGTRHMKYHEYVALRMKIESYGLKLAAIEGGFSPDIAYHDVIFGGPRQDELIEDLLDQVRDMGPGRHTDLRLQLDAQQLGQGAADCGPWRRAWHRV